MTPRDLLEEAREAFAAHRAGHAEAALDRLHQALTGREDDAARLLRAQARALAYGHAGDRAGQQAAQDEVIALLRRSGDAAALARALVREAADRMARGDLDVGARLDEALEQARAAGDLTTQAEVWTTQARVAVRQSRPGEAVIAALAGATAARRSAAWGWAAAAHGTRAQALAELGDLHSATRAARDALQAAQAAGASTSATGLRMQLALLRVRADALDEAEELLRAASRELPRPPGRLGAQVEGARARLAQARGDHAAARAAGERAQAAWRALGDPLQEAEAVLMLVEVALATADLSEAERLLSSDALAAAPRPLLAVTRAKAALHLPQLGDPQALALEAAELARGHGAQRLEDEALNAAVMATWQSGDQMAALQAALALAEARRTHSIRLREVRAAASDAASRVALEARATLDQTGLTATQEEAPDARSDDLERAAHGVRNALATISTSAELLAEPEPPLPRKRLLTRLLAAVDQAQGHLDRAVLDAQHGRVATAEVARLGPLAHRVVARYADEAKARGVTLQVQAATGVSAAARPSPCRDALSQLVRNGVLYCGPGDTVRVVVERDGDAAVVRVEDTGPGMPPERLAAFAEGRTSDAGLGISMVHRAITGVGGTVALTAQAGLGTTVTLRLPSA